MQIVVKDLRVSYQKEVLHGISCVINSGWNSVIGENGSGKTTFIKSILNLTNYSGSIKIDGHEVKELTREGLSSLVSYCPQVNDVVNGDGVVQEVILNNNCTLNNPEGFNKYASYFGLNSLLGRRFQSLSGGQKKRVLLASAFYQNTPIVILDEPFNELEPHYQAVLRQVIRSERRLYIVVLHSLSLALDVSDRILLISEGNLEHFGRSIPAPILSKVFGDCYYPALVKHQVDRYILKCNYSIWILVLLITVLLYLVMLEPDDYLRCIFALIVGGTLSCTGMVYQYLFQNRLCSPYTLGVSAASCLGSEIAIFLGASTLVVEISAFTGAMIVLLLLLFLYSRFNRNSNASLIFLGIVVSSVISSLGIVLQMQSSPEVNQQIFRWQIGGLDYASSEFLFILPILLIGWVFIIRRSRSYDLVSFSYDIAYSKGLECGRFINSQLIIATLMCSLVVALTGPIGFVGLIIPNIVYSIYRDFYSCFVVSTIFGGIVLLVTDLVANLLLDHVYLTAGTLSTVVGAIALIPILLRRGS